MVKVLGLVKVPEPLQGESRKLGPLARECGLGCETSAGAAAPNHRTGAQSGPRRGLGRRRPQPRKIPVRGFGCT